MALDFVQHITIDSTNTAAPANQKYCHSVVTLGRVPLMAANA